MLKKLLIFLLFIGTILHATIPTQVTVTKLYVATLDRAPDIEGLNYWVDDSKLSLEQIAISFFDQPETQKKYPKETSHRDFVKSIYENLFKRIPDNDGWDYWEKELDSQSIQLSVFILAVTNGALDDDAKIIKNRTTIALTFALSGKSDTTEASKILEDITDEEESVSKAVEDFQLDSTVISSTQQDQIDSNSPIDIVKTETPNEETTNEDKKQEDIPDGLILKESFENLRANNGWHVERGDVTGDHGIVWDTHQNGLEVERGIVSATIDGDVHAELDAHHNVTISTQVNLKSGSNYELSFYIKPRGKRNQSDQKDTSAMEISLGDNIVSIESDKDGKLTTNFDNTNMTIISTSKDSDWTELTITYTNITQDSNTLTIKGTGADDSYGMLLDNIELRGEASDNQEESNTQLSNITDEAISSKVQSVIDELEKIKIELSDVESYDGDKLKQEYDGVKKRFDDVKIAHSTTNNHRRIHI